MARIARGVAVSITQRGNHRQNVFFADDDRRVYLAALAQNAARYGMRILGYCLMTNHVHLIAVPEREDSFGKIVDAFAIMRCMTLKCRTAIPAELPIAPRRSRYR